MERETEEYFFYVEQLVYLCLRCCGRQATA